MQTSTACPPPRSDAPAARPRLLVILGIIVIVGYAPLALRMSSFRIVVKMMENFIANVDLIPPQTNLSQDPVLGRHAMIGKALTTRNGSEQECETYRRLLILSWVQPNYGAALYFTPDFLGRQRFRQLHCPKTCVLFETTDNRRMLSKADVVIFNFRMAPAAAAPSLRPPGTVYILTSMEAPVSEERPPPAVLNRFNFFWSYRRSLPLSSTYFHMINLTYADLLRPAVPFRKRRKTPLATLISNCHTRSGRTAFNAALMKFMEVHNYGGCLHNKEPPAHIKKLNQQSHEAGRKMEELLAEYVFYLSLENSICTDYITEKLGRSFRFGTLPIVASVNNVFPDYSKMTPNEHTVINILSFKTVQEVAQRLKEITSKEKLFDFYLSYRKERPEDWPLAFRQSLNAQTQEDGCPLCKLSANFLDKNARTKMAEQKPDPVDEKCAPPHTIPNHFNLKP